MTFTANRTMIEARENVPTETTQEESTMKRNRYETLKHEVVHATELLNYAGLIQDHKAVEQYTKMQAQTVETLRAWSKRNGKVKATEEFLK